MRRLLFYPPADSAATNRKAGMATPLVASSATRPRSRSSFTWRLAAVIFGGAFAIRICFLALTADTFDYDEFVLLQLAKGMAAGAVPYRDFMFFHPPGALLALRAIEPLTAWWWPWARVLTAAIDSGTTVMVAMIAHALWGRRESVAAGAVYALSPLALVTSTRVGQDPLITALGILGLLVLLRYESWKGAVIAGVCLAAAVWIKYPALYFLPIYLLTRPRRALPMVAGLAIALVALAIPLHDQLAALYRQSVQFQGSRWTMALGERMATTALYWLAVNPIALWACARLKSPKWLIAGYLLGALYLLSPQVYYHYFSVTVPFAAIVSAPLVAGLSRRALRLTAVGAAVALAVWAAVIDLGGSGPLGVTASHLSVMQPTIRLLDRTTAPNARIMADQYQYAYLARRPADMRYFWNIGVLVNAGYLEKRLPSDAVVIRSTGASSGYPRGFSAFLDSHERTVRSGTTTVWFLHGR